ncbi:SDR family NAD(P)-dependent oxidoreductase [Falsiroseomonas sp. HC035]|uniref:SDR family NAD(P)-dependent oxidoreductase n=1 Tax=Falsiroseomonas sp. HC035 TaxID=3390999 RepID=UPI003D3117DD
MPLILPPPAPRGPAPVGPRGDQGPPWVVTGASSGIGRGVAERAGQMGASVVLAARRAEALEDVARTIRHNWRPRPGRAHRCQRRWPGRGAGRGRPAPPRVESGFVDP